MLELGLFHATSTVVMWLLFVKHNFWQWEDEGGRDFVGQGWGIRLPLGVRLVSVGQGGCSYVVRFGLRQKIFSHAREKKKKKTHLWLTFQPILWWSHLRRPVCEQESVFIS